MEAKILLASYGVNVLNDEGSKHYDWNDILSAFVYKKDLITVDLICMALESKGGETLYVDEEMAGWKDFVDNSPEHLPGCVSFADWFIAVAFPAFETNPILIFKRDDGLRIVMTQSLTGPI